MDHAAVISRQRAFFLSGATAGEGLRRSLLEALHDGLVTREEELLAALHADLGKCPHEAYASELGHVMGEIRHTLAHLHHWMKPERRRAPLMTWPSRAHVRREPFGVALIIGPWNYPLQLLLLPLVAAIAAGNTAILKPSEFAPQTSVAVARLIRGIFDEECVAVVEGGRDVAEDLLREKFDTIFFTGSTRVGRAVMEAAARHLTPVTLELGGKCPCIVLADAPMDLVARRIVWGKFMNAGQTCVAPDHVWVDRRAAPALLAALARAVRDFYGENPQESGDYGRIIHRKHFDRLLAHLSEGTIHIGGRVDAEDLYIEPTILTGVPRNSALMNEEIFGPVLPVLEFDDVGEWLELQRTRPSPLALYLFTGDRTSQERVLRETRSGGVCINDTMTHIIGRDLPFGGLGQSGMGSYHGRAGFECFTHPRSVLRCSLALDPSFRYPPPKASLAVLKRLMRFFS